MIKFTYNKVQVSPIKKVTKQTKEFKNISELKKWFASSDGFWFTQANKMTVKEFQEGLKTQFGFNDTDFGFKVEEF